jgi:predicted peptidase
MRTLPLIAAASFFAAAAGEVSSQDSTAMRTAIPPHSSKRLEVQDTQTYRLNYLLFLPQGYATDSGRKWPLMLFLHGAGERGTDLRQVTVHGPPKIVKSRPDFPFILVSPQCTANQIWPTPALLKLLDEVQAKFHVDTNRVYVTGLSMGGYGTWDLGVTHPERFAAIAPVCGGGDTIKILLSSNSSALKRLGVWAFHGAKDAVVPLQESERMVQTLKRAGVKDVKLTVYAEANHDSWTETYDNPEFAVATPT